MTSSHKTSISIFLIPVFIPLIQNLKGAYNIALTLQVKGLEIKMGMVNQSCMLEIHLIYIGTHVAGIVGSKTYGVFKEARLFDVKVLANSGAGNLSTVLDGLEYIIAEHKGQNLRSIANLSVGAHYNVLLNNAVDSAVEAGIPMIVAAGNANDVACAYSPASASSAVTVGAIDDRYDTVASFSNWGSCIDIFASGVYVSSLAAHRGNGSLALSGTSMSAPIITGIVASYMASGLTVDKSIERLLSASTIGAMSRASVFLRPRTINLIAYNELRDDYDADL